MIKLKLGTISNQGFMSAMQYLLSQKLQVKTAWRVKGLVAKFNEELKKFTDLRKQILDAHCKKGENGEPLLDEQQNYSFEPEALLTVTKEVAELAAIEVEVNPIKLSELVDSQGKDIELSAQQLFDLGDLVAE